MAVWHDNFTRLLKQKEVLILHGNIRDTAYMNKEGNLVSIPDLIREVGKPLKYERMVSWGVFFNEEKGYSPMWSLERIESLNGGEKLKTRTTGSQNKEMTILTRWLEEDIRDRAQKTIFVINYLDKITPYAPRGVYPKDIATLITLIQKMIENISTNNRLIMVALKDTMIPLEYYTNSPKVSLMEIPMPDKEERHSYFNKGLQSRDFIDKQIDLVANVTDGLYMRDLANISRGIIEAKAQKDKDDSENKALSDTEIKKIVNRYRIGSEDDPWSKLPLSNSEKALINSAEGWFKERVIGQDHAVEEVVKAIKKARAGVVGLASGQASKPKAVFFFAGPTGVGKTFLAKKLADYLFDSEEAFVRLDMSEFKEEHTVSKIMGAPPGYVGYEKGGLLTNAVRSRPFSVVLFDEIEKSASKGHGHFFTTAR